MIRRRSSARTQLAAALGQPDLRIYDCTTYLEPTPPGSDDPYIAVPGRKTFEEGACSGRRLPRPAGRVLRRGHAAALHDAGDRAARGGLRPSRCGRGRPRRALQHRLHDVGDALLVDAQIARLRRRGGARRRPRQVEGRGRPTESGPARGYPPAAFKARPRPGLFVDKGAVLGATGKPNTVIVNALGPQFHKGLEPSRYGRPGRVPGSVNVPAATLADPARKDFTALADAAGEVQRAGRHGGQARDLLLRRRHLGDDRSLRAAPARLRRPDALRRVHGGVGEGPIAADRDRLTRPHGRS